MLQRIAPNLYQGTTGETVTIAAIARSNGGIEAATFRYGTTQLPPRQVQGHPGCEFDVRAGTEMFGALVAFDQSSPNARYEFFEEDDSGILQPLQVIARPLFGPIVQFQIAALPVALPLPLPPPPPPPPPGPARETAGVAKSVSNKAAKKTAKKAVKKAAKKAAKKTAKKTTKATAKRTARKAAKTAKKTARKTRKKTARKAAKRSTR